MPVPGRAKKIPHLLGDDYPKNRQHEGMPIYNYKQFIILVYVNLVFLYQRKVYYLLHRLYIVKLYPLDKTALDLIHVFFILPAEDDLF